MSDAVSSLREREGEKYGGSAEGIRHHYDIGNDFWTLVLGPTMTYSSALFVDPDEPLDVAQNRKIDWHLEAAGVRSGKSVLDVGCGWGSILRRTARMPHLERSVGLTLSDKQVACLRGLDLNRTEVRLESWAVHEPTAPYDSIISVGALEHFAKATESPEEKIAVYRDYFTRCHRWLHPGGRMSLQTIAFGTMKREEASAFMNNDIFPESDLPCLSDLTTALDGLFEIVQYRNDRLHYARTYDRWAMNLRTHRDKCVALVGEAAVARTERYFKLTSMGFRLGKQYLMRFALRPITTSWATSGADQWPQAPMV